MYGTEVVSLSAPNCKTFPPAFINLALDDKLPDPEISSATVGATVPMPILPSTIIPLVGAAVVR